MKPALLLCLTFFLLLSACTPATLSPTPTPLPPTETAVPTDIPNATFTVTQAATATETATPAPGIGSTITSPADGMVLVYVPAGPFVMGFAGGYPDEGPVHSVTLDAFWIDRTEVTNAEYELCVQGGACQPPVKRNSNGIDNYFGNPQYGDYPVVFVDWAAADAYCNWAGRRLPTEAEWEKAARGPDGNVYPWGNATPDQTLANFNNVIWDVVQVGSYPSGASPYGALDMAGNAWEWTSGWYSTNYFSTSPEQNPPGPETGSQRVLRGGSWNFGDQGVRGSYRLAKEPGTALSDISFRCMLPEE
jgi:eukaryotic-like serine/threonine-protein kinase